MNKKKGIDYQAVTMKVIRHSKQVQGIKYERITLITATCVGTGEQGSALDYIEVDHFNGACEILERESEELELTIKKVEA